MNFKNFIMIFFVNISMFISSSGSQEIQHYRLLIFPVESREQLKELKILGLTLDYGPVVDNHIRVIVNQAELSKLQGTNLKYEVEIEDMNAYYDAYKKMNPAEMQRLQPEINQKYSLRGFEFGSMGGYYTYDEIVSELDSMRLLYPDLITEKVSLGLSIEGREII